MADEIVTLAVYNNLMEAQMARNLLLAEGIGVQMTGETGGGLLPGMENTFGHFQLLVSDADRERAAEVLGFDDEDDSSESEEDPGPPSTSIRAQGEPGIRAANQEEPPPSTSIRPRSPSDQPARVELPDSSPPSEAFDEDDELAEKVNRRLTYSAEDLASRALLVSFLGLLACPPLAHVYSCYLLFRVAILPEDVSPAGMRKVYLALAINALVFVFFLFACLSMRRF